MDSDIDGMGISPCNPAMMRPAIHKNENCLSGIARGQDCVLLVDGIASRRDEALSPDTCLDRLVIDEQDEGIGLETSHHDQTNWNEYRFDDTNSLTKQAVQDPVVEGRTK